jgi:hypothetical protein
MISWNRISALFVSLFWCPKLLFEPNLPWNGSTGEWRVRDPRQNMYCTQLWVGYWLVGHTTHIDTHNILFHELRWKAKNFTGNFTSTVQKSIHILWTEPPCNLLRCAPVCGGVSALPRMKSSNGYFKLIHEIKRQSIVHLSLLLEV